MALNWILDTSLSKLEKYIENRKIYLLSLYLQYAFMMNRVENKNKTKKVQFNFMIRNKNYTFFVCYTKINKLNRKKNECSSFFRCFYFVILKFKFA